MDVQDACTKIGVQMVLCGGSCLGAVRHQGFIPWDDDLDIAITRKEWEVFKLHFEETLGEKYVLEAPNYGNVDTKYPWPKIYLKGSELVDVIDINLPYHKGIFIDIFVIENVSNYRTVQYMDALFAAGLKYIPTSILLYKYPSELLISVFTSTTKSKVYFRLRQLLGLLASIFPHKTWLKWYDDFASRHREEKELTTIPTGTRLYLGEMLPRVIWQPYEEGTFEGIKVFLPHLYHQYLANLYGKNYMQLPPAEKRETHPIVRLKFPDKD